MRAATLFIFIFIFFGVFADGQEKNVDLLKLSIKADKKQICFGKSVELKTILTNIGDFPIVIDTLQIGFRSDFSWFINTNKGNRGGAFVYTGHLSKNDKPNFIILQPNQSYISNSPFIFDSEDFTKSRNYQMKIAYGQFSEAKFENIDVWRGIIESNEIDISIRKCGAK